MRGRTVSGFRRNMSAAALSVGLVGGMLIATPEARAASTSVSPSALPPLPSAAAAKAPAPWVAPTVDPGRGSTPWVGYKPVAKGPENNGKRSKYTKVYDNSDGTHTVSIANEPVHFQDTAGTWRTIDPTVIADADRPGSFRSKSNAWTARFGPSGLEVTVDGEVLTMAPTGGESSPPSVDSKGRVIYANAWPGVDVRYTVTSWGVEQDLVVRQLGQAPNFAFSVSGVTLEADTRPGSELHDATDTVVVGTPFVQNKTGQTVDAAKPTVGADTPTVRGDAASRSTGDTTPDVSTQQLSIAVDPAWWAGLTQADLPLTIDPPISFGGPDSKAAYRADGQATSPYMNIGNPNIGQSDQTWRTVMYFDYTSFYGSHVLSSELNFYKFAGSPYGTSNQTYIGVTAASAWNYAGAGGTPITTGLMGDTGTLNAPELSQAFEGWLMGKQSVALGIVGDESGVPNFATWKMGVATLDLTLNTPPTPAVGIGPADGAVIASATPTLAVLPSTDLDGEAVTYRFQIGTNVDATSGIVYDSGYTSNRSVTVPSNVQFKDGTTYTWRADTKDSFGLTNPYPELRRFRFDRRLGDDPTQSYDSEGPVKIDLATGNVVTSVSTPTIATVAGPAGVSLSYNSFAESRAVSDAGVPQGWRLEAGAGLGYTNARIDAVTGSVVLVDGTGVTHEYKRDATNNSFTAPIGELGVLASIDAGGYSLADNNGTTYVFNAAGLLTSATTANDDKKAAALLYNYTGNLLSSVVDPVRNQTVVTLTYQGGACPAVGAFSAPPTGALCQATLLDGRITKVFYNSAGRLARVENPGAEVSDFGYDAYGNLTRVRDSFQADWVAVNPATRDTDYARTLIDYDASAANARATRVRLAAPDGTSATATLRPDRSFTYRSSSQTAGFFAYGSTVQSGVDVATGEVNASNAGAEIVTGTAQNADPAVSIFSKTGANLGGFYAYALTMQSGIRVAVGDVDPSSPGNEIITGTNSGAAPMVAVFTPGGQYRGGFYAYDSASAVGTDVAVGDLDGDGVKEIVTGAGAGAGPHVKAFHFVNGSSSGGGSGVELGGVMAYEPTFAGGVRVTTEDSDGDGRDEIVTGPGPGGGARVRVLRYPAFDEVAGYYAVDQNFTGGIDVGGASGRVGLAVTSVTADAAVLTPLDGSFIQLPFGVFLGGARAAMGDLDGDGALEIVVGAGPGGGPHVRTFSPSGVTDVTIAGLAPPNGYPAHRVVYDGALRTYEDRDAAARASYTTWDPSDDKVLGATDPAGRRSTTVYDANDRPTAQYGPAPAAWFNGSGVPTTNPSQVATTTTTYDTNPDGSPILGLAAAYWPNTTFGGAPVLHGTGDGDDNLGDLSRDWGTGSPGTNVPPEFAARYTGTFTLPTVTPNYHLFVHADDGVRVWVDGVKVLDAWNTQTIKDLSTAPFGNTAGQTHNIRVDYEDLGGGAAITVYADDGTGPAVLKGMRPNYGLATSTTAADGNFWSPSITTTTSHADAAAGIGPELGVATATTVGGLTTATTYETPGVGYLRPTKRTLPAGNVTTYANYTASETASPPAACTVSTAVLQGGLPKSSTSPSMTNVAETTVYDQAGRPIATTTTPANLTSCITYDASGRSRITQRSVPASGVDAARTVTYNYAESGDPLTTSVSDAAGKVTTKSDLLGRVTAYTDVYGNVTTTTYDQLGRPVDTDGPQATTADLTHLDYNAVGQVSAQKLGGSVIASPLYDAGNGELTGVTYPSGTGKAGNGTTGTTTRDSFGKTIDLTWKLPNASTLTSDHVVRSQSGRIIDETIDGSDAYVAGTNFSYDNSGRLIGAVVANKKTAYSYAATGGCGAMTTAGANSNRTTRQDYTVDNNGNNPVAAGTFTSCYNNADQLTSATGVSTVVYDNRGNTRRLSTQSLGYDGADRNTALASESDAVSYLRDATDRIIRRTTSTIGNRTATAGNNASGATTLVVAKPGGTIAGDVMLAQISTASTTAIVTAPSGWALVANSQVANGTGIRSQVYWKTAGVSEPSTYTWTFSASNIASGVAQAYTGVNPTTPIGAATTTATASSLTHTEPSVTPATSAARIVETFAKAGASSITAPQGVAMQANASNGQINNVSANIADRMVGTQDPTSVTGLDTWTIQPSAAVGVVTAVALKPATQTVVRYGYSGDGDTSDITQDASGVLIESNQALIGGVLVTKAGGSSTWSYPNIHGDTGATANNLGAKVGPTFRYDAFGNPLSSGEPDNATGTFDYGWLGTKQRGTEHPGAANTIEMGARLYNAAVGRFLGIDPVPGASANDYDYCNADPLNCADLSGTRPGDVSFDIFSTRVLDDTDWYGTGVPVGVPNFGEVDEKRVKTFSIRADMWTDIGGGRFEVQRVTVVYRKSWSRNAYDIGPDGWFNTRGGKSRVTGRKYRVVKRSGRVRGVDCRQGCLTRSRHYFGHAF